MATARAIIAGDEGPKIVFAEIDKHSNDDRVNKDLNRGKTWSWQVVSFLGFYDLSAEIYDGWPQYVEDNYAAWVENTKGSNGRGMIGFWGYTVVREVDKEELLE